MDLMNLTARDLSNKCLEAFQLCLTFRSPEPDLSNQQASHDERFEYRLADFNLWIDGIGALAPSKASLDARLSERPIDLSLVKGNLVMLFQSLEDCLNLLNDNGDLEYTLLDIDSALESLVTLSLAIRRTGRRSRLHKADRLFKAEEHAELRKHLEAIIFLRPGSGPCFKDDEFRTEIESLTPLQNHLITANLKRRNRFIQAQLHSLGLKKRTFAFELPTPEAVEKGPNPVPISTSELEDVAVPIVSDTDAQPHKPLPAPMSVTSASVPESKLEYREPISKKTESTPMTVITQITASARYPRPRVYDNEQRVVQCPCCCQTLPVAEAKNNNRWRKHLAEDIRPYTCIFDSCPTPDVYYSSRSMLEQHFRQDHPPVWICPLCDEGSVYSTMSEMMDHLHKAHPDNGEDISSIISSSAQTRVGIKSCPLCEVNGEADSPELIDHVLEHVHDFSLRSLPWPKSSEVDIGGEVGSFNWESGEAAAITQWLEVYEHDMEDIDPTLKLSTCDYARLAIITEQMESVRHDKLGLDIGFADDHGDDSAEAETDVSKLTQDTLESIQALYVVLCHQCSARWYRDEDGMQCPKCQSEFVEILEPESGSDVSDTSSAESVGTSRFATIKSRDGYGEENRHSSDATGSKPSTRESISGFRRFTDRLFSRKKADNIEPRPGQDAPETLVKFLGLKQSAVANQQAWKILSNVYYRRLDSPTKTPSMFANFIRDVQHEDVLSTHPPVSDLDTFLQVMVWFYLSPLKPLPPKDLSKPISNYFINSSHETTPYISIGPRSTYDAISHVLNYGYRSINIDVWNGTTTTDERDMQLNERHESKPAGTVEAISRLIGRMPRIGATDSRSVDPKTALSGSSHLSSPAEPIVTDGNFPGTPCGFRGACQLIRSTAFIHTNLPVIINIMVHANPGQQDMMVKIMREEWREMLVDEPLEGCDPRFRLPKLEDLQNRILVRISTITSHAKYGYASQHAEDYYDARLISIIQPLAKLGVYLRQEHFESFNTPLAKSPNHLFSFREDRVQGLIRASPTELFQHNQHYFLRVYPNASIQASSNLEPLSFWRHGVQMAAICGYNVDEGMMLNEGMFADESGWVLKPVGYQSQSNNISTDLEAASRKELDLSIFVFRDQEFLARTHREIKDLSSFMRASLHVDDEVNTWVPGGDFPISTDDGSGALGYELNFHVAKANPSIFPKLSILR
ncbi:related to 1-phosphatidylinositol-4,5-bisphosphate phosphodiesterase [Fusarium fujikuroi IMI 58289]|uniref:Phosphoinositide phospholipase C n=1 Tax=Gibberella fujikuroi (strain CBS 195.34 / IMI 58289 / NRRL A-6831) TaxID=1279085 RepID=S0EHF9_GIBF5|nr:related to 1-phosphatidylinositol-4,5-bisphosphate phosphodiesterase [Fusarium fujikuroi IMI 58289]CCT74224.1 related to 1-phosphatidylinositol-4,5-bisphosphate phosphodiesterase [Fusarium fujikuroi IMI 58289]SCO26394.1 related to 1-phosphatidylinositol-4,5-bisphosphate phosphodiesterase [Fusarium fujikuroi]SCO58486.1 related to 1-phosphatidylinositol-4,5-bisphosphate phosphodiesterase [Fusarium fujikuroi]